jgi:hypothetical protein
MISAVLKSDIDDYVARLRTAHPLLARAKNGTLPPTAIGRYLASIHYLLTQTPVNLRLAGTRALEIGAPELARYFETKLGEETGHDEWAAADRGKLNAIFGAEVDSRGPARAMLALVECTRAALLANPYSYLAYILFAEYFTVSIGPEWMAALESGCGVPPSAMTAISHHVELDEHHVLEGSREIDALVTDERVYPVLRETILATTARFTAFCDELCE